MLLNVVIGVEFILYRDIIVIILYGIVMGFNKVDKNSGDVVMFEW